MYKKKLYLAIIPLLTFTCLSLNVFADEIQLKKAHCYRHIVVKNNMLLDISDHLALDATQRLVNGRLSLYVGSLTQLLKVNANGNN
jgi:hypothetical protein